MPNDADYKSDIIPRSPGSNVRVATFNCENLFARPKAMNLDDNKKASPTWTRSRI